MNIDDLRDHCLSFPGATEDIIWGSDLCFCVGEKMFAVTSADSNSGGLSLKCTPDSFAEMTERPGVEPAAYVGRYGWIHVKTLDTVPEGELKTLIERSYQLVFDKLPSKVKKSLS